MQVVVPALVEQFLEENPSLLEEAEALRSSTEESAMAILEGRFEGGDSELIAMVQRLRLSVNTETSAGLEPEAINRAIAQRAADLFTEKFIKHKTKDYDLSHSSTLQHYSSLPNQTHAERRIFMINGGVASGKGTAEGKMLERAEEEGVNWDHVVKLNTDSFKGMLLDPRKLSKEHAPFYSGVTHDEASLIRNGILEGYHERVAEGTAPHLYVDQVWPAVDIFQLGGASEQGLDVTIVQIPVENSFSMAYGRGERTGRFEDTAVILRSHAMVPRQLFTSLEEAINAGNRNIRLRIVANVGIGSVEEVASINLATGQGEVANMDHLLRFYQKTSLNQGATSFGTLYSTPESRDLDTFREEVKQLASYLPQGLQVMQDGERAPYLITEDGREEPITT